MKKVILLLVMVLVTNVTAQKSHRIGYIDMEYILKNIPAYLQAQNTLDTKVGKWQVILEKEQNEIETMKTDLANEKAILTKELISEREEDIQVKEEAFRRLKDSYFGTNGKLYSLRRSLVQPIQDQVYNLVQIVATRKKLDFVFDKSSDLIMLYANKKHDISDIVVKLINIDQRKKDKANKVAEREDLLDKEALSDEQKDALLNREQKRLERKKAREEKIRKQKEKREEILKRREELREKRKNKK